MKYKWEDITGYTQVDGVPLSFGIEGDHGLSIIVTRWINGAPEKWYLTCQKLGIERQEMSNKEIDGAKHEALIHVARLFKVLALAAKVMKENASD
jgi:hypothetical protein